MKKKPVILVTWYDTDDYTVEFEDQPESYRRGEFWETLGRFVWFYQNVLSISDKLNKATLVFTPDGKYHVHMKEWESHIQGYGSTVYVSLGMFSRIYCSRLGLKMKEIDVPKKREEV